MKTAPVSMNGEWGNKIRRVHIMEDYSAISLEELTGSNMDEPWKHYVSERKPDTKATHIQRPEWANPWRRK